MLNKKKYLGIICLAFGIIHFSCSDMIEKGIESKEVHNLQSVTITSHRSGDYVAGDITLEGAALTLEGEEIFDEEAYEWTSETDGLLGTGTTLSIDTNTDLTAGQNTIILEVIDVASGAKGRNSIRLNVGKSVSEDFNTKDFFDETNSSAYWDIVQGVARLDHEKHFDLAASYKTYGDANEDYAYDVYISADDMSAYVLNKYYLRKLDITDIDNISEEIIATPAGNSRFSSMKFTDDEQYIYVGMTGYADSPDVQTKVLIIENINPYNTTTYDIQTNTDINAQIYCMEMSGGYAYIGVSHNSGTTGLEIIDIGAGAGTITVPVYVTRVINHGPIDTGRALNPYSIAIAGDTALVGCYKWSDTQYLVTIDISTPSSPTVLGRCAMTGDKYNIEAIEVSGNYAFLACLGLGYVLVDITTPDSPSIEATYDTGGANDIELVGNTAYIAGTKNGLTILDVTTPAEPEYIGGTHPDYFTGYNIDVSGHYAHLIDLSYGLRIINLYSELAIAGLYYFDDTYSPSTVVAGTANSGYAYVVDKDRGLISFDVTDADNPVIAGSYEQTFPINAAAIYNNYVYVYDYNTKTINIFDISEPANPDKAGSCVVEGNVTAMGASIISSSIAASGDFIYVSGYEYDLSFNQVGRMRIVDVSTPSAPVQMGLFTRPAGVRCGYIKVVGDYAYISQSGGGQDGLIILDISDPMNPAQVPGGICSITSPGDLEIMGDYAYIACQASGLTIVDVSDVGSPTAVPGGTLAGIFYNVDLNDDGDKLYITTGSNELYIVDISDVGNPVHVDTFDTPPDIMGFYLSGNHAYFTHDGSSTDKPIFTIVQCAESISNLYPTEPQIIQSLSLLNDVNVTSVEIISESVINQLGFIGFEVSNDGANWQPIYENTHLIFQTVPGGTLRWKARLLSSDVFETPVLENIELKYWTD